MEGGAVNGGKADFSSLIKQSILQTHALNLVPGIDVLENTTSVTEMIDLIIQKAWEAGASDIHMDPSPEAFIVRYRIDGILHDIFLVKKELQPLIITRIKVLSGLRTDEHFAAQDGRFRLIVKDTKIDLRVSILTTYHGENVVMRLLISGAKSLTLDQLGFSEHDYKAMEQYIKKPHGMILATGPTGSGKTTTLYSILQILNTRDLSIVTIEDPIEYEVQGITQIQVNTQTNLTFAAGLRSIVRQDPNTILVGEIRDAETAEIAVNAAMTGHRVLSTLHTTDAATTLPRLLDMGVEPFLIASTVNLAIGQRLVRKLCPACKVEHTLSADDWMSLGDYMPRDMIQNKVKFWRPVGCDKCSSMGYSKRIGIYEILELNENIRNLIMKRGNADQIKQEALKAGMVTMLEDGFRKAALGLTSIAEILRVIHD